MGNTRSISAQKPRLSEKNKFLFNQIDKNEEDNFPKIPLSTKTTETMNKNIKINEEDFRTIKKPSGLKEINETIKNCSYIAEYSYLANPNLFFLQISSLSCNPEKINTKKEIQYYLDFPLLFGKTVKSQNLIKTPRNSKTLKDNNTSDKSNEEPNSDLKRNSSSIVKDGTSKLHNNRDLSSPKEDGSTPHFDKKFLF